MVRETRHLWVGNLPKDVREDKIKEHFKRYSSAAGWRLRGSIDLGLFVALSLSVPYARLYVVQYYMASGIRTYTNSM